MMKGGETILKVDQGCVIYQCDIFTLILDIVQHGTVSFPALKGCIIVNITFVLRIVLILCHYIDSTTFEHSSESSLYPQYCHNISIKVQIL